MSNATIEQLLDLITAEDSAAFAALHHRVHDRVAATAHLLLRNTDFTQEVTQEVFLQIWQRSDRYDPARGTALGWIHCLTRGRAIDRIRTVHAARTRDRQWASGTMLLHPPTH